jgi:hypothetical protein
MWEMWSGAGENRDSPPGRKVRRKTRLRRHHTERTAQGLTLNPCAVLYNFASRLSAAAKASELF